MRLVFQQGKAKGLNATYHFVFTGTEPAEATVLIRNQTLSVVTGLEGRADLRVQADSNAWLRFLDGRLSILRAIATRSIRLKGSPRLMKAFAACFPK